MNMLCKIRSNVSLNFLSAPNVLVMETQFQKKSLPGFGRAFSKTDDFEVLTFKNKNTTVMCWGNHFSCSTGNLSKQEHIKTKG